MKDYKKILEGLVNIINNTEKSDIGFANICTFIGENCPELKEYEDERIRKEIIDFIDTKTIDSDERRNKWFSYLEKQGNTNIFDVPKISIKNAVEVTSRMQYIDDDIKPIAEFIMDYANWDLHKDEWNQPTLTVPLFRVLDALIQKGKPYCECNQNIEKQGEHNPADKAEPKFKVSDYVVDNCGYIWRIEGIINKFYILEGIDGGESRPTIEWVNKTFHLWDITKDAKDGDVLYTPKGAGAEGIFLIKGWEQVECIGKTLCSRIGYRVKDDEVVAGGLGAIWWEGVIDPFYPATKEQRDLLFQKMKEAGYEWDAEKKELKKIEQKPTWSKEDESNFQGIIDELKANKHNAPDYDLPTYDRFLSWLKSIKDRYTWKPSDEQMKALDWALSLAKNCGDECAFDLRTLQEQLKKL